MQYDDQNQLIGGFYCDLFARKRKQQGAWVSSAQSRFQTSQHLDLPIIHLVCNFTPCEPNSTALINHQELVTLYHEFGHCLHCVLTETHYPSVSGTSGVPWDAVELPSQLMENWVWDADFLKTFARHRQTNQPIPDDMLTTLCQSRSFLSGLATLRQLEFAVFDIRLHRDFSPKKGSDQIQACIDQTRKDVAIVTPPGYNRFPNTFSHIFSGSGYAAGYYSYKWAEVLSSDAFSVFEQHGILDQATGLAFKNAILSKGGSVDPKIAYEQFKGGPASSDALIRQLLGKSISDTVVTG